MERKFEKMGMSNLLDTTSSKFNELDIFIENCEKELILTAHSQEEKMKKKNREIDFNNRKAKIEKMLGKSMKDMDNYDRLTIGAALCETNPNLIPNDMAAIPKCYKAFKRECKSTGTSILGVRQFKCSLLLCIKNLIRISVPQIFNANDYEWSDSTSKKDLDGKIEKAIFLYQSFEPQMKPNITFG